MDAYEATRIVFSRIQSLDPENAPKIMGLLLIQDHGEKEMIRLAFGPEALLHSVVLKARKDLGLLPPSTPTTPSSSSPSPFLLGRQNSSTRLMGSLPPSLSVSCPSWAPSPAFSRTNSSSNSTNINGGDDLQNSNDELISPSNPSPSPFYGGDLIDDFQLQDQLSFLNDPTVPMYPDMAGECRSPSANGDGMLFPYAMNWGVNGHHRKSCSVADLCLNSDSAGSGFGWKPCLYYARGYCKNGMSCRFLHGMPDDSAVVGGKMDAMVEQQCHELLMRSKSQRLMASAAAFPYSPTPASPSASSKCMNFLLQQQQSDSQRAAIAAAAAAALMLGGDDTHKFMGRSRLERSDLAGMVNPGSRQIYLTFPADSTFREEDVSNYFSIYGPVQDVRIPYQQKRMFGFVTFVYPETVKLILAKGNPHFVCDARVLVKPYKEKGKVPDKYRKQQQQQAERGDFSGCSTPNGLDSRDPYDLQQLGARMLYNSNQEALLRRKLEEQQQASDLQHAIELQGRRFMGLQLLDFKTRNLSSSPSSAPSHMLSSSPIPINSTTITAPIGGGAEEAPPPEEKSPNPASTAATTLSQTAIAAAASDHLNPHGFLPQTAVNAADKEESAGEASPNEDSDFQESSEHNLPDSPFASPTKSSYVGDSFSPPASAAESDIAAASPHNNHLIASNLLPATSTLDMASFNSCFFQMPRFSSGHGAVGM